MRAYELLKEDARWVWSVTLKDQWTDDSNVDDYLPVIENWEYDVRLNGKVVGSIQYDDYFGIFFADFGARGVEISKYADRGVDYENDMERYVLSAVGSYFNSKTGQKHFEVMSRQQNLQPQSIEEEDSTEECTACDGKGVDDWRETCVRCGGNGRLKDGDYYDEDEKEELEEIKVTKTLAGKRTKPTQDLATKEKMSRKKKYKDGSEKKDASTPMNRNVHDLANITLKGEYRS